MGTAQSFDGRIALITGGTQGLGYATASLLKAKGANGLMLVGRDAEKGQAAAASLTGDGCRAEFTSIDLADADGPAECAAAVDDAFGTLHATVNCAAATFRGTVWDSTAAMWDEMLALNVRSAALVAQESAKLMVREGVDGSIVLIGSVARHGGNANLLPYSASKMALVAATRNMAYSLMRHRVRVNLLNPGWMDTPAEDITQRRYEGATDGWLERAEAEQPMGRLIKPDEIAHTIVHLCSPESGFLTGQDIDWDQTILGVGPGVRPGPELGDLPEGLGVSIRVGVIGVGGMGACHARHVVDLAGAELAWVADPDEAVGRSLAGELGCEWLAEGMDRIDEADALVIACPDRFHHRYVMAGLERGLPVLAEKPLTVELADALEIVDAEVALGRRLIQLGFMRVYDERHLQVAAALDRLGAAQHIRCVHRNTNDGSRTVPQMLVESIIHDIHTVRWLGADEIVTVATSVVDGGAGTRMIVATCRLASGAVAVLEFDDIATGYEVSVEVTAEHGNVVASEPLRASVRADGAVAGEIGDDWFSPFLDTYRVEMRDFLASVEAGIARGPSAWDGYAAQAVVEAAAASAAADGVAISVDLPAKPALYSSTSESETR